MEPAVVKEELRKFGETVSVKGISRILKARSAVLRILWLLAVLLCFALLLWQVSVGLLSYFSYPVQSIYQEGKGRPVFPDVTICKLYSTGDGLQDPGVDFDKYLNMTADTKKKCTLKKFQTITNLTRVEDYNYIWSLVQNPSGYFTSFPPDKDNYKSENNEFIIDNNYFTWEWDIIDAEATTTPFWSADYNLCYTIKLNSSYSMRVRGLTLILYIDNFPTSLLDTFFPMPTQSRAQGVRVVVHGPGSQPNPKNGLSVGPGTETTVRLGNTVRTRLQSPYGNCTEQKFVEESDERSGAYNTDACYDICLQEQFIEQCGCAKSNVRATPAQLRFVNNSICGDMSGSNSASNVNTTMFKGVIQLACLVQAEVDLDLCQSSCPEPCKEYMYDVSVSSAPWPHVSTQLTFYDQYIANQSIYGNKFEVYDKIKNITKQIERIKKLQDTHVIEDNFIQLNIIFDRYNPMLLTEVPSLTPDKMLSLVGGALSLWLGITVMTVVELVQFVFDLMDAIQQRKKKRCTPAVEAKPPDRNTKQVIVTD